MAVEQLALSIIEDNDDIAYANRCTAAKLSDKRESYFMFLQIATNAVNNQDKTYSQKEVEQCAALLQEHYSQHIVQLQSYKIRKRQF